MYVKEHGDCGDHGELAGLIDDRASTSIFRVSVNSGHHDDSMIYEWSSSYFVPPLNY